MLSLNLITLAYIIGILWGLYLELNTLIVTSIFLCLLVITFTNKVKIEILIISLVCVFGAYYTSTEINKYDTTYYDGQALSLDVVVTSHFTEKAYIYKYNCKSENGDKFILYFKKNSLNQFEIGEHIKISGKFNLPDVARNKGGFDYRRYLNSNGYYGTIMVENLKKLDSEFSLMKLVYSTQNYINNTFKKYLSKDFAGI